MTAARDAIERVILISVGAAALTKERAEEIVADLVARGHIGTQDASAIIGRLMATVRGEGPPTQGGLSGRIEDGVRSVFRETGIARASDIEEIRMRLAEIERRVGLLEAAARPSD